MISRRNKSIKSPLSQVQYFQILDNDIDQYRGIPHGEQPPKFSLLIFIQVRAQNRTARDPNVSNDFQKSGSLSPKFMFVSIFPTGKRSEPANNYSPQPKFVY